MGESLLKKNQLEMAHYLRDPDTHPAPAGVEPRRLKIYQDLIYNNIEGFISGGFPVLRSLYEADDWRRLVRSFIDQHRCHTPYFLEISQEFLQFLMDDYHPRECDPPFMTELAHYEWVELALDVSEERLPDAIDVVDILSARLALSPLAWLLSYRFQVHHIGPGFQPGEPTEACYLVVYRDRCDQVRFMELNAATARLLELIRDNGTDTATARDILHSLAGELGMNEDAVLDFGSGQLRQLLDQAVVVAANGE